MKVVFISTMLPSGHFSQYITSGLQKLKDVDLIIYADKNPKNLTVKGSGAIKCVFSQGPRYLIDILRELPKDKPDIIHVQQEMNMYGGPLSAVLFPFMIMAMKVMGYKVIVTLHAAVFKKQINREFIQLFHQESPLITPTFLRLFFHYIFAGAGLFADKIMVHSNLSRKIFQEYSVAKHKIVMVRCAIPLVKPGRYRPKHYFFYFGYMVRRKGLGFALDGFQKFIQKHPNSDFKLLMAGGTIPGQEAALEEIKQQIKEYGLTTRVKILGFVEQDDLDKLYDEAYAVIIPGVVSFGSSGPLYHCNSYNKCPITSKIGHFIEDIDDKKTGILTNNDAWYKAYEWAIDHPQKIREIERNVAAKAASRTPVIQAQKYMKVYENICSRT